MKKAQKSDWKVKEMPIEHEEIRWEKTFTKEEYEKLKMGVIPKDMEDKWFVYCEDDKIYFHISWSGYCIFIVNIEKSLDEFISKSFIVNRNKKQYKEIDFKQNIATVWNLLRFFMG